MRAEIRAPALQDSALELAQPVGALSSPPCVPALLLQQVGPPSCPEFSPNAPLHAHRLFTIFPP
eukprot:5691762-Pleurochrysis_carterae.AAC.1